MTRIADRLLTEAPQASTAKDRAYIEKGPGLQWLRESIVAAVRFDIDNVATYIADSGDYRVGNERWAIGNEESYPNVAPPYPIFWMEYRRPHSVASFNDVAEFNRRRGNSDELFGRPVMPERTAALFEAHKVDWDRTQLPDGSVHLTEGWAADRLGRIAASGLLDVPGRNAYGVEWYWVIFATAFMALGDRSPILSSPNYELHVDRHGKLLHAMLDGDGTIAAAFSDCLAPALLAMSFLHCRNVLTDPEPNRPPKLLRAYQKRHGVDMVRFHTLQIEPMRKVLADAGAESATGLHKALHIARGHFRDYSEGRGLFGKLHGIFWVDSHVRGRSSEGTVFKDYNVNAPKEAS